MNTHIFSAFGRSVAPALLAASTMLGSLGFSSVASAQERVVVAAPAQEVVVGAPVIVRHRHALVSPYYYGGYFGPAWRGGWGGYRGFGGFHGGGFHGGGLGGFHGGAGGFHGGRR